MTLLPAATPPANALRAAARRRNLARMSAPSLKNYRIGIAHPGKKIEAAVLGPDGTLRQRRRIATPPGYDASLAAMAGLVRVLEAQSGGHGSVGIGIPGVISPATGLVKNANSIA